MTTDAEPPRDPGTGDRAAVAPLAPVLGGASTAASQRGPRLVGLLLVVAIVAGLGGRLVGDVAPSIQAVASPVPSVAPAVVRVDLRVPGAPVTTTDVPVSGTLTTPDVAHVRLLLVRGFSTLASIDVTPVAGEFEGSIPVPSPRVEGRLVVLVLAEDQLGRLVAAAREPVTIGPRPVVRTGSRPGWLAGDDGIMAGRAFREMH